ncbi:MAG: sulfate adenylyltransferase subunit CysN [Myxococcota bacterium]
MVRENDLIRTDISAYLERYQNKELLRFVAVGSVDDGKSTLIGRLLHDTGEVYEDQLEAVKKATTMEGEEIDFSLFTDGLKAEREQGITIDVAYRYFATEKRKFIIADTPGHIQYTRNMVTGASTADVALILIDARLGVLQQSRRHGYIASLLGIPHLAVCVNKMDLVGYDQQVFERIRAELREFTKDLSFSGVTFFPISALKGDNLVSASPKTPWYDGPTVLEFLETVPVVQESELRHFRYPVQYVVRPNLDYRGFAGQIVSGIVKKGDEVMVLPSGKKSHVKAIDTYDGELEEAFAPQSVCIRLDDEIDCSRGDTLVKVDDLPNVGRTFDAHIVWMSEQPLDPQKTYILKHTTQVVRVQIDEVTWKKDMDTLEEVPTESLSLNDIGRLRFSSHRALFFDGYTKNRGTGAFILVDSLTNNTVAAGMIAESNEAPQDLDEALREIRAGSGLTPKTQVSPRERRDRMGQKGAVVWLVGLPGSGRWSLAYSLERRLFDLGRTATVVDPTGEDLRSMISAAKSIADAGLVCICAFPSYQVSDRDELRERIGEERVIEVYVNTDEALCRERRPDADFSGFEPPRHPEMTVALHSVRVDAAVEFVLEELEKRGQFEG